MYGNRNLRHGCICGQCYKYTEIIKTKRLSAGGKNDDRSLAAEVNPGRIGQSSLNKLSPNLCVTKIDLNAANGKQPSSGGKNGLSDITNTLQNIPNTKNNKPFSLKPAAVLEKSNKNNKDGISPAAKEKKVTFAPKIITCADAQVTRKRYFYTKSDDLRSVVAKYREERLLRKEKSAQSGKVANIFVESSGIGGEVSKLKSFFQPLLSAGAQPVSETEKGGLEGLPKSPSNKNDKSKQKMMASNLEIPAQAVFTGVMDKSPTEIFCPEASPKETAAVLPITKSVTHGEIEQSVSIQQNQQESKDVLIIKSTVTLGKESPISIETTLKSENLAVKRESVDNTSSVGMLKLEGHSSIVSKSNDTSSTAMVVSTEVFDKPKSSISQEDLAVRRKSSVTMSIPILEEKLISIFGTGSHTEHSKIETSTNAPADDKNPEKSESTSPGYTPKELLPNEQTSVINDDVETSPQNPESTDMDLTQIDKTVVNDDIETSSQNPESSDMELTPIDKTKTTVNSFKTDTVSPKVVSNEKLTVEAVTDEINTSHHTEHTSALRKVAYPSPDSQAPAYLTLLAGRRSIGIQTTINQPQPPLILLPMVSLINAFRETDEYKNVLTGLFGTDVIDDELFEKVLNPMCWSLFIILVFVGLIFGMMRKFLYFLFDLF